MMEFWVFRQDDLRIDFQISRSARSENRKKWGGTALDKSSDEEAGGG